MGRGTLSASNPAPHAARRDRSFGHALPKHSAPDRPLTVGGAALSISGHPASAIRYPTSHSHRDPPGGGGITSTDGEHDTEVIPK